MTRITRTQFLSGDWGARRPTVRPPWALAEDDFVARCTRCGDCLGACPTGIIEKGRGGFPLVSFASGACTFCGKCVEVCRPAALVRTEGVAPWGLKARIGDACLARRGVVCRSCGDRCEARAIRFRLAPRGVAQPELDSGPCTGCGACVAVCPASAITMCEADEAAVCADAAA